MHDFEDGMKETAEKIDRINALSFAQLIARILKHYSCPSSCNAYCCRVYDIPVSDDDKKGFLALIVNQERLWKI